MNIIHFIYLILDQFSTIPKRSTMMGYPCTFETKNNYTIFNIYSNYYM